MCQPIHISDTKQQLELPAGTYSLKVLGGWNVITNNFSAILREVNGETVVKSKEMFWKTQSYAFGKSSKKRASIVIPKTAIYKVEFVNPADFKSKEIEPDGITFFPKVSAKQRN